MKYSKHILLLLFLLATGVLIVALLTTSKKGSCLNADWERGVYYWRTTFQLDDNQLRYLDSTGTDRLYIRFFDVDLDNQSSTPIPVATIQGLDSVPAGMEVVPTVYITLEALSCYGTWNVENLANSITERVLNMISYHEIENVREVQLDCDWTVSTEPTYFALCSQVRQNLQEKGLQLSVTLRLWQLRCDAPPADRVVLMLYNTGDFRSVGTRNSILDINDVRTYLSTPVSYPLPLDIALPQFSWNLCYNLDGSFRGILRGEACPPHCTMRHEEVSPSEIADVVQLVRENLHTVNSDPKTTYFSL